MGSDWEERPEHILFIIIFIIIKAKSGLAVLRMSLAGGSSGHARVLFDSLLFDSLLFDSLLFDSLKAEIAIACQRLIS